MKRPASSQQASKRVLIVNFYYPPTQRFGGAIRWKAFLDYLPEHGWDPHLLACREGVPQAHSRVTRIRPWIGRNRFFRLDQLGWIPPLYRAIQAKVNAGHDIIVLSGPPMWYLCLALRIRKNFPHVRVMVDFRDPWRLKRLAAEKTTLFEKMIENVAAPRLEHAIVRAADLVTVVSPGMLHDFTSAYPFAENKIRLLPNGHDIRDITISYPAGGPFTLLYSGSFDSNQNPGCIFEALQGLELPDFQLIFMGSIAQRWQQQAQDMGIEHMLRFIGHRDHAQALAHMNRAHAFLQLLPQTMGHSYHMSGKTYEYIFFGRPIILLSNPGDCAGLVRRFSHNAHIIEDYDPAAVRTAICDLYSRWKQGAPLSYKNIDGFDERFSRRHLTRELSDLLKGLRQDCS